MIVHANEPYRDVVVDLGINNVERYSEFVTVVVQQVKAVTGNNVPVKFLSEIKYNNSRTAKKPTGVIASINFQLTNDPKITVCALKPGKNHANTILIPENLKLV